MGNLIVKIQRHERIFCFDLYKRSRRVILLLLAIITFLVLLVGVLAMGVRVYRDVALDALAGLKTHGLTVQQYETQVHDLESHISHLENIINSIKKTNENLVVIGKKFTAVTTAYTPYAESTGKGPEHPLFGITRSGIPAGLGICAADPTYWKFGTVLQVAGYGVCVIADTGSAIKGPKRFDLYIAIPNNEKLSVQLARQWGVRRVLVTVLYVPN